MSPRILDKWKSLSPSQRRLYAEAAFWLPVMSASVNAMPLRRVTGFLGLKLTSESLPGPTDELAARDVSRAVAAVASRTPWTSTCLAQALAGARMLRSRGLQASVVLGVAGSQKDMAAHAWLEHGSLTVTGARVDTAYSPIGRFSA